MPEEYSHLEPGEQIESVSGHYTVEKDLQLEYQGRALLVIIGHTIIDRACCGAGGCRYAFVPGYVLAYRARNNPAGAAVSLVEPVAGHEERGAIEQMINEMEIVQQVLFG